MSETLLLARTKVLSDARDYFEWNRGITKYLDESGLYLYTSGRVTAPVLDEDEPGTPSTRKSKEVAAEVKAQWVKDSLKWEKDDRRAMTALKETTAGIALMGIEDMSTSREMWLSLHSSYKVETPAARAIARNKLALLFMSDNVKPAEHMKNFHRLTQECKACGVVLTDGDLAIALLQSLDGEWAELRVTWANVPQAEKTFSRLVSEYGMQVDEWENRSRKKAAANAENVMAFQSNSNKAPEVKKAAEPKGNGANKKKSKGRLENMKCFNCNDYGHMANTCSKAKDTDKDRCALPKYRKAKEEVVQAIFGMGALDLDPKTGSEFLLDSGATCHVVNDRTYLSECKTLDNPVTLHGLGSKHTATEGGVIYKQLGRTQLKFKDVLLIPEAKLNILSFWKMSDAGWRLGSDGNRLVRGKLYLKLEARGNLRYINLGRAQKDDVSKESEIVMLASPMIKLSELHCRWGHISPNKLRALIKDGFLDGLSIDKDDDFQMKDCATCRQTKITRHPFNNESYKASKPLQLIHSDLSGMFEPSLFGQRYYVTFIDDCTKFLRVYFLKTKDEVQVKLPEYVTWIERQFDSKVKAIRTDGGGEYLGRLSQWYQVYGITHFRTEPYTSQHLGVAERYNRTIKEMASSMLTGANMPMTYWMHAVSYAVVVINFTGMLEKNGNFMTSTCGQELSCSTSGLSDALCGRRFLSRSEPRVI